jgi:glucokinase
VLGLDFGGTKIAMMVCEPSGERIASSTVASGGELGARASFERGMQAARALLADAAAGRGLAAVGVSTFGIPFDDRVELAPAISGWDKLAFGHELRDAFPGARIVMVTDAKAAAQAEVRWGALAGYDPAVYLNLGTGLSAAIVAGGQVLAGMNGAAGEIGYNLRTMADVGVPLAARTTLEDMISGQALARRAAGHTADGQPMAAGQVFEASRDVPGLDRLLTDFAAEPVLGPAAAGPAGRPDRRGTVPAGARCRPVPLRCPPDRRDRARCRRDPGRRRGQRRHHPPRHTTQ